MLVNFHIPPLVYALLLFPFFAYPQGAWNAKSNVFPVERAGVTGFSIGTKGYFGTGWQYSNGLYFIDFWEWDQATDAWTQKADFPAAGRGDAVGFSINGKGYIGTGTDEFGGYDNDFWEYDTTSNSWTQKADFPGNPRGFGIGFSIGDKGYIGLGWGIGIMQDFWEWDQGSDTWTQKADFPTGSRAIAVGFSIGDKGYIGTGIDGLSYSYTNDFWEFNPDNNSWTQKADFPGNARGYASGFGFCSYGFLGTGEDDFNAILSDMYMYSQATDTWTQITDYPHAVSDIDHASFSIGCKGYFGTGANSPSYPTIYYNDFYEYEPPISVCGVPLFTLSTDSTPATCTGNNGTATVTVTGGSPPYTYIWSPGGQTTPAATGLAPGIYFVLVIDSNGMDCTGNADNIDTVVVTATSGFTSQSHTIGNISCFGGNDGSASISVSGGTPPYTYQWSNTATSTTLSGLSAGTYTVTVYDAASCKTIDSMVVSTSSSALAVTVEKEDIFSCNGTNWIDGSIDLNVNGGVLPYTYSWSTGGTTQDLPVLTIPGIYSVTVTDGGGCSMVLTPEVEQLIVDWYVTSVDINFPCGASTASITVRIGGYYPGALTYTWYDSYANWIPGDSVISNLSTGNYTCEITDEMGCIDTFFTVAISNATVVALMTSAGPRCYGSADGTVAVNVVSGVPPYTYLWSNTATTAALSGLGSGSFTVTVTDSKGCTTVKGTTLTEPALLKDSLTVTNTICGTSNGNIIVYATGGTGSYTWQWSTGATTQTISNLAAGKYFITVTDVNNCSVSDTAVVTGIGNVSTSPFAGDALCYESATGWIDITATGGTPPYQYLWSNNAVTEDISAITAGIYIVSITDNDSCLTVDTFTITQPDSLYLLAYSSKAGCNLSNGYAWVEAGGGMTGYSYLWDNFTTDDTLAGVTAGNYYVTVIDANGCSKTSTVTVNESSLPIVTVDSIRPVSCYGGSDGNITIEITGGTPPYFCFWNNGDSLLIIDSLESGNYSVTVTDSANCKGYAAATVTAPASLTTTTAVINATCTAGGAASVTVTGGTPSYSYRWSNGESQTATGNLQPAKYTVTITDANSCTITDSITIVQTGSITATAGGGAEICARQPVQLWAGGGSAYLWSTGETGNVVTVNPAATAVFIVTITEGICSDTASVTVMVNPVPLPYAGADTVIYIEESATLTGTVSGGTPPMAFLWMPVNSSSETITVTPPSTATYYFSVTDAKGCTGIDSLIVEVIPCDAEVFVPNAFAPDCNCPDDRFRVFSDCIDTMELVIFDRWGEKVYEIPVTDYRLLTTDNWWNGHFKGKPMDAGTYVYIIKYTTINKPDEEVVMEGNVHLMR